MSTQKFTRSDIERVLREEGLNRDKARKASGRVVDGLAAALKAGYPAELRGFGGFEVRERKARKARNPKTGEAVAVEPGFRVIFRPGRELKKALRGNL